MHLFHTGTLPAEWEDLITENRKTYVTIYTAENAKEDNLPLGISKGKDDIFDVVLDVPILTEAAIQHALALLSAVTSKQYSLF